MLKLLGVIGLLAILAVIAGAAYFLGGFYSVAATADDPAAAKWAIAYTRQSSISRHAIDKPPGGLDAPATVQAGARAFAARGCTTCHGGPGVDWAKFAEGLRPDPPDLSEVAKVRDVSQLFWVIKNGVRMTAMPAFGAIGVDDNEIWQIATFVKKLPDVAEADYKAWTAPPPAPAAAPPAPAASAPPAATPSAPPAESPSAPAAPPAASTPPSNQ